MKKMTSFRIYPIVMDGYSRPSIGLRGGTIALQSVYRDYGGAAAATLLLALLGVTPQRRVGRAHARPPEFAIRPGAERQPIKIV